MSTEHLKWWMVCDLPQACWSCTSSWGLSSGRVPYTLESTAHWNSLCRADPTPDPQQSPLHLDPTHPLGSLRTSSCLERDTSSHTSCCRLVVYLFRYNSLWVQQSLHEIIESVFAPEWKMLMALQFIHECQKSQEAFGGFGTSAGHSHTFSSLRRNDIACGGEKLSQYLRFTVSGFIYVGNGIRTLTEKTTQPPTNNYYSQS